MLLRHRVSYDVLDAVPAVAPGGDLAVLGEQRPALAEEHRHRLYLANYSQILTSISLDHYEVTHFKWLVDPSAAQKVTMCALELDLVDEPVEAGDDGRDRVHGGALGGHAAAVHAPVLHHRPVARRASQTRPHAAIERL